MMKALISMTAMLTSIRDCGNGQGRAALLAFESQPVNPRPGDNVTLWVAYDLPDPSITGGTATYSFTYNGIPFPHTANPLCDETSCPKSIGFNNETSWSEFPSGINGKITSSVKWTDQNDELVWCVETTWKV